MTGPPNRRSTRWGRVPFGLALCLLLALSPTPAASAQDCDDPCVGPSRGSLVLAGGGRLGDEIFQRFVDLAGGPDARIVIIPTASRGRHFPDNWPGTEPFLKAGAAEVRVLHTRDPAIADSDDFIEPLRNATGAWLMGGRSWRLVDAYLHTRVEDELHLLAARGGVVGGTSAGASILASYLVRGAPEDNEILMAPGYETGFGFLVETAVDQHVLVRGREQDLLEVLHHHPNLLGIGIDEGSAIVVEGDWAEVVGRGPVGFYDPADPARLFRWLGPGERFDLGQRRKGARVVDGVEGMPPSGLR